MTTDQLQVLITADTAGLRKGLDDTKRQLGGMAQSVKAPTDALRRIGDVGVTALKVGVVASIAAVAASIPGAVRRIDTLVAFPRVLEAMGASSDQASKATKTLSERLLGLPTPLQEGAAGVQALVAAGLTVEDATGTFLAFNNATLAASVETGAAQGAFTQLTQAISKGKIEGQEWNSIVSAMPTAFQALSKESGKSREELRELYKTNPNQLLKDLQRLDKEGGGGLASLNDQARAATGGIGTAFANMKNAITRGLEGIVKQLGNGDLEAGQRKISDAITATGKAFGDALKKTGEFFAFIIANKDIFLPIGVAILTVVTALTAMSIILKLVAVSQAIWNGLLFANPIGLVVLAVAALVAGLVYFFTQTELGKVVLKSFFDFMATAFEFIKTTAKDTWDAITGFFSDAWENIKDMFKAFIDFVKDNWFIILLAVFTGGLALLVGVVVRNWDSIVAFTKNMIDKVVSFFRILPPTIGNFFQSAWNTVRSIWSGVASWFGGVVDNISSFFSLIPGKLKYHFVNAVKSIMSINWGDIGVNIVKGIGNGISSMGKWLADKAKDIVGGAKDQLMNFLGINSPSTVFRDDVGKNIGLGVAEGITGSGKYVLKSASELSSGLQGAMDKNGSYNVGLNATHKLQGMGNDSPTAMQTIIVKIGEDTLINKVVKGINNMSYMNNETVLEV